MSQVYLEVTYRDGRPYVAYLYLPSRRDEKRHSCRRIEPGMILDISKAGNVIGIELTAPTMVTLGTINGILKEYGLQCLQRSDLALLLAAL